MSKKAVYGIIVALLLPLIGYFTLKNVTERAVMLPRHIMIPSGTGCPISI
jgi:hypothetical protein